MLRSAPEVAYVLKLFSLVRDRRRQYKEHVLYRFVGAELAISSRQQNTRRFGDDPGSNIN